MNFNPVKLRKNNYKMIVKIMRKALIQMVMSQKLFFCWSDCWASFPRHFFDFDGSILQSLEERNEILDEMFVCFLYCMKKAEVCLPLQSRQTH